jgi:hypothetical protein
MFTDFTPPSKDTNWQTGLKRKIQQSAVYRRPISLKERRTGLGWKTGRFTKPVAHKNQAGVTIFVSDIVDVNLTLIKLDKEGHSILIKRGNRPKGNNNYQPICTQS